MTDQRRIAQLPAGYRVREYEILKQISEGGQGRVYIGRLWAEGLPEAGQTAARLPATMTPEQVAAQGLCIIKVPHPGSTDNLRDEHAFLSNPATAHPRIISLFKSQSDTTNEPRGRRPGIRYESFTDTSGAVLDNHPCLILTYEPGGSLRDLMRRFSDEPIPPGAAVTIGRQVAEALNHLHTTAGIVHHDVSPSNIVLRRPLNWPAATVPDCVLVDLAAADSTRHTRKREVLAKPRYRAPERRGGSRRGEINPPPDIYSLGVVLYELLAGRAAVHTERVTDETGKPQYRPLPPLRERQPQRSEPLAALITQMVDQDPARRPTAAEVATRLAATPEARLPATLRANRPPRALWPIAVAALVAVVAIVAVSLALVSPAPARTPTPTPLDPTVTPFPSATVVRTAIPTLIPTSTPALAAPKP